MKNLKKVFASCIFLTMLVYQPGPIAAATVSSGWETLWFRNVCVDNSTYYIERQTRKHNSKWEYRTIQEFVASGCMIPASEPKEY
jgi:hypothetical protein